MSALYDASVTVAGAVQDEFLSLIVSLSPLYSIPLGVAVFGALLYALVRAIR